MLYLVTQSVLSHQTHSLKLDHHDEIILEVADTDAKRQQGLMFREKLSQNAGMLLLFDKSYPWGIWMKNMHFPIDIIWLNAKKQVVDFKDSVPPCPRQEINCPSYVPKDAAIAVIELQAGQRKNLEIKLGQVLKY